MGSTVFLLLVTIIFASPAVGLARSVFIPRLLGYSANVTVEGGYDFLENDRGVAKTYDRTQVLRESMNLETVGYVYHPNLLIFQFDGSGFYENERNSGNKDDNYKSSQADYGIQGEIFRRKPLNAKFYAKQENPFLVNSDREDRVEELSSAGVSLHYREGGFLSTLKYDSKDEVRSNGETKTDNYDAYGSYYADKMAFVEKFNVSAWGQHQKRRQTQDTTFDNLNLTSAFAYKILRFNNSFNYRENESPTNSTEMYGVSQSVYADLPWNFSSVLRYSTNRNDTERYDGLSGLNTSSSGDADKYDFTLTQKLFSSLVTRLRANLNKRRSEAANYEDKRYSIETEYSKELPGDSFLRAGLGSETTWNERQGQLPVKDEPHEASQGGLFFLGVDADPEALITISVYSNRDNCFLSDDSCWIVMKEGVLPEIGANYEVDRDAVPLKITVSSTLKNDIGDDLVAPSSGIYIFKVNYFLNEADYTIRSDSNDFYINLRFFNNIIFDYTRKVLRQEFDEDEQAFRELENISPKTTDDQVSLSMQGAGLAGRVGYKMLKSETDQQIYDLALSYKKDGLPTGVPYISAGIALDYNYQDITSDFSDGYSRNESQTSATSEFWALATVPKVLVVVTFNSLYDYLRGNADIITFSGGTTPRFIPQTGLDDRDVWTNSLTFNRKFNEQRTKIKTSVWANGRWDRTTGSEDTSLERYEYGIKANRSWVFGGTTFSINARHQVTHQTENNYESAVENKDKRTDTKFTFKIVRKLF